MDKKQKIKNSNIEIKDKTKIRLWGKPIPILRQKGIGRRIILIFSSIMIVMLAVFGVLTQNAVSYRKQYHALIDNVDKINRIKTIAGEQPRRILESCLKKTEIAGSGEAGLIETLKKYQKEVLAAIGNSPEYIKNQEEVKSIGKYIETYEADYKAGTTAGGEVFSLDGYDQFADMETIGQYIADGCNTLITLELSRSSTVQNEISNRFRIMIAGMMMVMLIVGAFSAFLIILLTRSITKPLSALKNRASVISEGNLGGDFITVKSRDEIRDLAEVFNHMTHNLRTTIQKVSEVSKEVEESIHVVNHSVDENSRGSMEIAGSMEEMCLMMSKQREEAKEAMDRVNEMNDIAGTMIQSAGRIGENADISLDNAEKGNDNINTYVKQLNDVNMVMKETADEVQRMRDSAKEMNHILNTISEISSQTNLLSLNASIEAARAGEAGRGFEVVASEIRNLAESSQSAAGRIGEIIRGVQENAFHITGKMKNGLEQLKKGNELADKMRESFQVINGGILIVNNDIKEIRQQIANLNTVIKKVSESMAVIDEATGQNVSIADEITSTVTEESANLQEVSATTAILSNLALDLEQAVSKFKL